MPLLEMKSDLSKINTNFGSDTTTAGNTTSFSYDSLFKSTPPSTISIGWSTTPVSDYVSAYSIPTIEEPTTNTTTTTIQAQTQQESGNLFAGGIPPVSVTLTQPLTTSTPSLIYNPNKAARNGPSTLLQIHKEGRDPALSLEKYYNQLTNDTGMLGIRNDNISKLGAEHPYIIREIGDRWGIDRVQEPSGLGEVAKVGINLIDQVGGAVFGRDPSVFVDRYFADVTRLTKAANPVLSLFTLKQGELQKRNPFEQVTTTKYGLESLDTITIENALDQSARVLLNPQVYNPGHIYSVPGVLHISRMGMFDVDQLRRDVMGGIATFITDKVYESAMAVGSTLIDIGSRFISDMGVHLGGLANWMGDTSLGQTISGFSIGTKMSLPKVGGKLPSLNIKNPFEGLSIPTSMGINLGINANQILQSPTAKSLGGFVNSILGAAENTRDAAVKFGKTLANDYGRLGKAEAKQMNIDLSDVGTDKVNLIPYASDTYKREGENKKYDQLDWIPFKFMDSGGRHIVFRALLSGITDTFTPEYSSERYVGRPDNVYVYQGTTREISFTFDVYPKSAGELVMLWEKLNYLAGLTYPDWAAATGGGMGMIAPFCKLTIGQMYNEASGYISALTYTVMDTGTWETTFAKLPKYIQVNCTFVYIGDRLPSSAQKHYDLPWVSEKVYHSGNESSITSDVLNAFGDLGKANKKIDPLAFETAVENAGGDVSGFSF
jgi:hypothetical protein